ncbi:Peptidyl-prolyl cis-trans isomerase CYP40 [Hordeum vulgare]|nr:Peptidyl-prolyl cis-trans isomerase CYP40 [Hordeum vulgare]
MARCARRTRQRSRDAAEALVAADVGGTESHSPTPRRVHQCAPRNRVVVDVGSFEERFVTDLMSTDTVWVTGSDEEELGMEDGGSLTPVSRLVSHVLMYLLDDRIDTMRDAASRRSRTSSA